MLFELVLWLLGIAVLGVIVGSICLSLFFLYKYNKPMAYLREHHPAAYEQARSKPIWRNIYLRGAADRALHKFAAHHEPLNDPTAEVLLADYLRFFRRVHLISLLVFAGWALCMGCMCGPLSPLYFSGPAAPIWSFLWRLVSQR